RTRDDLVTGVRVLFRPRARARHDDGGDRRTHRHHQLTLPPSHARVPLFGTRPHAATPRSDIGTRPHGQANGMTTTSQIVTSPPKKRTAPSSTTQHKQTT